MGIGEELKNLNKLLSFFSELVYFKTHIKFLFYNYPKKKQFNKILFSTI